jgi:hypothetical protein
MRNISLVSNGQRWGSPAVFRGCSQERTLATERAIMLQQLNRLALPTAISIASFEAVFFVVGSFCDLTEREVVLGVLAGGVGGLSVLVAVLWQSKRKVALNATN